MPSGTLHQYFKQPSQKDCSNPIIDLSSISDTDDSSAAKTPSNLLKRKGIDNASDATKRRKLSLSNLRAKQSNLPPVLPASIASTVIANTPEHNIDIKINPTQLKCATFDNKQLSARNKAEKSSIESGHSPEISSKCKLKISSSRKAKDGSISKSCINDETLSSKVQDELKISSPVKQTDSPIKLKKTFKRGKMVLSDSDEEISELTGEHTNSSSAKDADADFCSEKSNLSELEQSFSRRSSRTRKPVARYTIEASEDETDSQRKASRKKTPKKKKDKENTPPSADIMVIDDNPPPRRSISSVLGGKLEQKKKKIDRPSSLSMMKEAKKLMQVSSKNAPVHFACASSSAPPTSVHKALEGVIWPTIAHCGVSNEIIMYPLLEEDPEYLNALELCTVNNDEIFRYNFPLRPAEPHSGGTGMCYDDCIEELVKNHPGQDIEKLVDQYSTCSRSCDLTSSTPVQMPRLYDRPWTELYRPTDHKRILGNKNAVKQLFKWLDGWRVKLLNQNKTPSSDSSSESEYDFSEEEGTRWLDNVVLITGPTGVGKTAAITTCVDQLGYKVLELNASSERTGRQVAELFSEASQSHSVTGKSGAADFTKLLADISAKNEAKHKSRKRSGGLEKFYKKPCKSGDISGVIEIDRAGKSRKKKKSGSAKGLVSSVKSDKKIAFDGASKVEKLSLIVLEEVDIAFEEDRGFLQAIVALTQVAKRPLILTSNDPNIVLPTDAEFLVVNFSSPKSESLLLNVGCLTLSRNHHCPPYQLQQYVQYHNSDIRRLLLNLEFLTALPAARLQEVKLLGHFVGVEFSLESQKLFLEQTQGLNLQFVYLNWGKLQKNRRESSEKRAVLELVMCSDTFMFLDQLAPKTLQTDHCLFPVTTSSCLLETNPHYHEYAFDDTLADRAAVEDALLTFLNPDCNSLTNTRINYHKLKDRNRFGQIKETQRSTHETVSAITLTSRSVMDEFSALRGICKVDKLREESGTKRRFKHYLNKEVKVSDRQMLAEHWLGS